MGNRVGFVRRVAMAAAGALLFSSGGVAQAGDIGFGIGVSYVFGGGVAAGIKAFGDDEGAIAVGSVGLDYLFASSAFRPNIGMTYQGEGYFSGGDVGYNLITERVDVAAGVGLADEDDIHALFASEEPVFIP